MSSKYNITWTLIDRAHNNVLVKDHHLSIMKMKISYVLVKDHHLSIMKMKIFICTGKGSSPVDNENEDFYMYW